MKAWPLQLRVLATSRPETDVSKAFRFPGPPSHLTLSADNKENIADVAQYIRSRLRPTSASSASAGISDADLKRVLAVSAGNFLVAQELINALLGGVSLNELIGAGKAPQTLSALYTRFMELRVTDHEKQWPLLKAVFESVLASSRPIEIEALLSAVQLSFPELTLATLELRLKPAMHFLRRSEERVSIYHKSFADWLLNSKASGEYVVDVAAGHRRLAARALACLSGEAVPDRARLCTAIRDGLRCDPPLTALAASRAPPRAAGEASFFVVESTDFRDALYHLAEAGVPFKHWAACLKCINTGAKTEHHRTHRSALKVALLLAKECSADELEQFVKLLNTPALMSYPEELVRELANAAISGGPVFEMLLHTARAVDKNKIPKRPLSVINEALSNADSPAQLRRLVDAGADPKWFPLWRVRDQEVARQLLTEFKLDVNGRTLLYGYSALHKCPPHMVPFWIGLKANVDARDDFGRTPLFFRRDLASIKALLDAGADASLRADKGATALTDFSAAAFCEAAVPLLLKRSGPLSCVHFFAHCRFGRCVKVVLAQPECKGWSAEIKQATTPDGGNFFHAMYLQYPEALVRMPPTVQQLLAKTFGVDPAAADRRGFVVPLLHVTERN